MCKCALHNSRDEMKRGLRPCLREKADQQNTSTGTDAWTRERKRTELALAADAAVQPVAAVCVNAACLLEPRTFCTAAERIRNAATVV